MPRALAHSGGGVVVVVGEHSVSREILLRFLNEIVCGFAESIDQSVLKPTGILDVQSLLDGKHLREQVDKVLKAIDSVGDPIERADAFGGVLQIAMASIQIGMGFAATPAKRKNLNARLAAISARRSTSKDIDCLIAALAGPVEAKHPTWNPNRVAKEIADPLNEQLTALGIQTLGIDAIRKRVDKRRTTVRPSDKKQTDVRRSK